MGYIKTFNGKKYEWIANTPSKTEANSIVKSRRQKGYSARITQYKSKNSSSGYRYDVWVKPRK